jgi:hypothetical protein
MTCPVCKVPVGRWAALAASGLSGIVCDACGAKLVATFESRLRLTGGGFLLGNLAGGLLRSLAVQSWIALAAASAVLVAWFLLRTEGILVLEPAQSSTPSIT